MRIVSIYRYFWPDNAPYGRILKILLSRFYEIGHECTVLTGFPAYNYSRDEDVKSSELVDHISVKRFKTDYFHSRAIDFFIFFLKSFVFLIQNKNKYDLIIINSFPPVFMGFFSNVISKLTHIPYIYHIQDVHPECLKLSNKINHGILYKLLQKIDLFNCMNAIRCVTLSSDMKNELIFRGYNGDNIHIINNPSQTVRVPGDDVALPVKFPVGKFTVLFAGNLGKFQSLEIFVEVAKILNNNSDIVFVFMGDGTAKNDLVDQAGDQLGKNIIFFPYQKAEVAGKSMEASTLGLVSLNPGLSRVAFPSKVPTLLSHGCPVLVLVDPNSELARIVSEKGLGFVLNQRSPQVIANEIECIWNGWKANRKIFNDNLSSISNKLFGLDSVVEKWEAVLNSIDKSLEG